MPRMSARTQLASPADISTYGQYVAPPVVPFGGRITPEGEFTPRPFRYHVYGGRFCPWSHRLAITRELAGLHDVVTMSYVDNERDGRGWAFRERYGPDPVNGFTLLREAYEATVDVSGTWPTIRSTPIPHTCGSRSTTSTAGCARRSTKATGPHRAAPPCSTRSSCSTPGWPAATSWSAAC